MVDITSLSNTVSVRRDIQIGGVPKTELKTAKNLAQAFGDLVAKGKTPSGEQVEQGRALLKKIDSRTELYLFQAGVQGGDVGEGDFDRSLHSISRGIETAQNTAEHLRRALKAFTN